MTVAAAVAAAAVPFPVAGVGAVAGGRSLLALDLRLDGVDLARKVVIAILPTLITRRRRAVHQPAQEIDDRTAVRSGARHLGSQVAGAGMQLIAGQNSVDQLLPVFAGCPCGAPLPLCVRAPGARL